MRAESFIQLIDLYWYTSKATLSEKEKSLIDEMLEKYPFFIIPHFVKAKYSGDLNDLFSAATYAPNRILLQKYMQIDSFSLDSISKDFEITNRELVESKAIDSSPAPMELFSIIDTSFYAGHFERPNGLLSIRHQEEVTVYDPKLDFLIKEVTWKHLFIERKIQYELKLYQSGRRNTYKIRENEINSFLKNLPNIRTYNPLEHSIEVNVDSEALASVEEDEEVVSETLAKLHLKQGNLSEAKRIFEKLRLQFPEKSVYFASQIEKLNH